MHKRLFYVIIVLPKIKQWCGEIMIISFCGHSDFKSSEKYERQLLSFFEKRVGDSFADMYLGGYGSFDAFALECCKKYKETHSQTSLVFVTPYLSDGYI